MSPLALPDRPPAVLLFDAGNTLVFLDEDAVAAIAAAEGVSVGPGQVQTAQGGARREYEERLRAGASHDAGLPVYVRALFRGLGAPFDRLDVLVARFEREHARFNLWRRVPDGVPEALSRLRAAGVRLGVVSNSEGAVEELLEAVGLRPFLELVVDSGREGVSKPDPEIFRRALERMEASPADAIYVGDVPGVDVAGARAAGLGAVLLDAFDDYPDFSEAPRVRSVTDLAARWAHPA